tara:strand:- start:20112 stop:20369 length:258 start_codon:yes stop_codon:yes gene_type:complete
LKRLGEDSVHEWTSAVLYVGRGFEWDKYRERMSMRGVQWISCHRVWGEGGNEVRGVLVGRVDGDVEVKEGERSKGVFERLKSIVR